MSPVFYYRERCPLCEELAAFLFRHWPRQFERMQWIDVDTDLQLAERFGERVPVLIVDGREVCFGSPDAAALAASFGPPDVPVQ